MLHNIVKNSGDFKATRDPHRLMFHYGTKVKPCDGRLPYYAFNFVPFQSIIHEKNQNSYLVDVIGAMSDCGDLIPFQYNGSPNQKINFVLEDESGNSLKCTIFGEEAERVVSSLNQEAEVVIVIVHLARLKMFQNEITLTNSWNATKVLLNPNLPEVIDFKHRPFLGWKHSNTQMTSETCVSIGGGFFDLSLKRFIVDINQAYEAGKFAVVAIVQKINMNANWFYESCNMCRKKLLVKDDLYWCLHCNKQPGLVIPRYMIHLTVMDETDTADFVLFDKDGFELFKRTAHDLRKELIKEGDDYGFPEILNTLVNKKFVFVVEVSYQFNIIKRSRTYTIIKLTQAEEVFNEFLGTCSSNLIQKKFEETNSHFVEDINETISNVVNKSQEASSRFGDNEARDTQSDATPVKNSSIEFDEDCLALSCTKIPMMSTPKNLKQVEKIPSEIAENEGETCETPGVTSLKVTSIDMVQESLGTSDILTPKTSATKILNQSKEMKQQSKYYFVHDDKETNTHSLNFCKKIVLDSVDEKIGAFDIPAVTSGNKTTIHVDESSTLMSYVQTGKISTTKETNKGHEADDELLSHIAHKAKQTKSNVVYATKKSLSETVNNPNGGPKNAVVGCMKISSPMLIQATTALSDVTPNFRANQPLKKPKVEKD